MIYVVQLTGMAGRSDKKVSEKTDLLFWLGTYLVSDVHVRVHGSFGQFSAVLLPKTMKKHESTFPSS
jgi:hypothetical protein